MVEIISGLLSLSVKLVFMHIALHMPSNEIIYIIMLITSLIQQEQNQLLVVLKIELAGIRLILGVSNVEHLWSRDTTAYRPNYHDY